MKEKLFSALLLLTLAFGVPVRGQIASMNFDPARDGLAFKNYRNEGQRWKDDLLPDDLVRMFGPNTSCDSFDNKKNCKMLRASAAQWRDEMLEAMDTGHCEGIAVACLRMKFGLPYKGIAAPSDLEPGAQKAFALSRSDRLENYIAYYWVTQTFDEVKRLTAATAASGPIKIGQMMAAAMKDTKDTFVLRFAKYDPKTNRVSEPHAVLPFAVEEKSDRFVVSVYDNNFPGQTRFVTIEKTPQQRWEYNSKANIKTKADYVGDRSTQTLSITATSWREGRCFASTWRRGVENAGCGIAANLMPPVSFLNASFPQSEETAELFLTDDGDMLVTDPDGNRIGYDPKENYFFDEIPDSLVSSLIGGNFEDVPHYTVPFVESDEYAYSVVFSGKYIDEESDLDFVYAAPYFTVGFSGIRLDPKETLEARIATDGEQITFVASADGETPEVFYAFDSKDEDAPSYFAFIDGVELSAGKELTYDFDFENGKLFFSDNDGNEDSYDIKLIRINPDGTVQVYEQNDLDIGKADRYEMDFGTWDGEGDMCFKDDEDGDGFADEQCEEEANEEPN